MDPSRAFLKSETSEPRGRRRLRDNGINITRSTSAGAEESFSARRMLIRNRLYHGRRQKREDLLQRGTASQTRYGEVADVVHIDMEPESDEEEELVSIPDIIWGSRVDNTNVLYRYTPLRNFTDFRLLHVLPPPADSDDAVVQGGFTRHNSRADSKRFVPFIYVEDAPGFHGDQTSLIMLNGLPFRVSSDMEAMLKSVRSTQTPVLLFNRSICIGDDYKVYEASSHRWDAKELDVEIRQLCTLRRLREPNQTLGVVLRWDTTARQLIHTGQPFDISTLELEQTPVDVSRTYNLVTRSERPAKGAQKDTILRQHWEAWDGEDGLRPWARQLGCRTRSVDSHWHIYNDSRRLTFLPPSERPLRRSRSEQRDIDGIRWRGEEVDMDALWDGLYYIRHSNDFLWRRKLKPRADFVPFTHSEIDYDKECVLAQIMEDQDDPNSMIRCGLLRFQWDRLPEFTFVANSMAFNPYFQATIQINGQFARISRSLDVCLRSLRRLQSGSTLLFVWPLCVPLHRMIDTSWLDAMFLTVFSTGARKLDAQGHLASLPGSELERLIAASHSTSRWLNGLQSMDKASALDMKDRDKNADQDMGSEEESLSSQYDEQVRRMHQRSDPTSSSSEAADVSDVDSVNLEYLEVPPSPDSLRHSQESSLYSGEARLPSPPSSMSRPQAGRKSVPDGDHEIATIAFRDFDHANKTGKLAHVRDTYGGVYIPLDPVSQEVRLIAAAVEDPADPSRIEVEIGSRDMSWGYIALSYCWGPAGEENFIRANKNPFRVRKNLYEFLTWFRPEWPVRTLTDKDKGTVVNTTRYTMWIDALSINQKDAKEKSREVRRMNQIYQAADFVLVWLGQAAANIPFDVRELLEDPEKNETKLRDVADQLVASPYFFRAWCTQELAVNKQTFFCIGTRMLPWASFITFTMKSFMPSARALVLNTKPSSPADRYTVWLHDSGSAVSRFHVLDWLRYRLRGGKPPTLLSLLAATSHCQSTVRSDQIYSLWSLACDAATYLPDINYLKTGKAIFSEFAKSWIYKNKRYDILALVESSNPSFAADSLDASGPNPSWVPDWTTRRTAWPLLAPWYSPTLHAEVADLDIESQHIYNADGGLSAYTKFVNIGGTSCLIGDVIRADRLVRVLDKFSGLPDFFEWNEKSQSWFEMIREHFNEANAKLAGSSHEWQLLDALVAGRHHDGRPKSASSSELIIAHMKDGSDIIAIADLDEDGVLIPEPFDTDENPYLQHVMLITAGRRLAFTEKGYIGLVPGTAKIGDEVVVVFGCCMPLIFRRNNDGVSRTLVGECYFHDMMNGEVLDAARQENGSLTAHISAEEIASVLKERMPKLETNNGFGAAMASLVDLFVDPPTEDRPQIQWFCIR